MTDISCTEEENCKFKCKTNSHLKIHLWQVHDKGDGKTFECEEENCKYKCKSNNHLKRHLWLVHDIGDGKRFPCKEENCEFKCKSNSDLKRHLSNIHDIGDEQCDICIKNVFKLTKYFDSKTKTNQNICRKCYNKVTGKNTRIEKDWSDYTDKHLGIEYLLGSDKSLKYLGGCQLYRPDKLYVGLHMVEVDECDEHQHISLNDYSCDEKRLSDIYEENGICGKTMVVIRWNPDTYKVSDGNKRKTRKERLEMFVKLKKHLRKNTPDEKIHIYYMFYDIDNPLISKNIPNTMIYEESDFLS